MSDKFLICVNCVNWGQPWKLGRKTVLCDKELDSNGEFYTANHAACKYFIPIQNELPPVLQRIRLLVQYLNDTEASYVKWASEQRSLLLGVLDSNKLPLSFGDYVKFRYGLDGFYGTLEGLDPQNSGAVIINSPAFPNSTISLLSYSVTKITGEEAKKLLKKTITEKEAENLSWQIDAYIHEIASLESRGDKLTIRERESLIDCKIKLSELESNKRYFSLLSTILA